MSQSSVTKVFKLGGVLYAADSATIHVTRNDTGADVVAAGTNMTSSSTGVYTHTWTDPAAGLVYTYTVTLVVFEGTAEEETYTTTGTKAGGTDDSQNLLDLVPDVMMLVPGCSEAIARQALRLGFYQWCYDTGTWKVKQDVAIVDDEDEYTLTPSYDAFIRRIESVMVGESEQRFTFDTDDLLTLDVAPVATTEYPNIEVWTVLVPTPDCETVSAFMIERWGRAIRDAAILELAKFPGRTRWSHPGMALYERSYRQWVGVAKRENITQRGTGTLAICPRRFV